MCMYVLFMQIDNSIHNRVFYRHNAWPNTLKSRLHMDSSDLYNVKNYSMPCRTFCVSGLCTRNVTTLITVTSKVTLQIPRVQCSGWHFPRASSRPRQVRLLPFRTSPSHAQGFHSQTAQKTSLSNSLLFWKSRRVPLSSPSVVISKDTWAGRVSFWHGDREHPPNLYTFLSL